ncbi:TetR family transcriptional regulator [Halieaceae bacterium IMCC14734]|uniref:TetR family transcriptional regulator n=1 Tax=Candidatus Litorirhabdus singularis TaxID=2518993 RepID=A0ABT3TJP7_9GAMM|nr:TetR family transcriptional regulator [Candidatus Litorirhabdus singularis]MCX2982509.1 TetR family transcriptional regulator [Candidatus Litorirhabdus singularis]
MPDTETVTSDAPTKRTRRTQERAELTRAKLLDAGILLFSERGFDAVSVRDLETAAGVKRNLLSYHFNDKDTLWKASADAIVGLMSTEFSERMTIMKEVSGRETLAFIVRFYVYFHARHPELSRLMSREATRHSWRTQYLIDTHIRPSTMAMEKLVYEIQGLDRKAFIHWYYIMISSTSTIFSFAAECEDLFGVDPCEESMVEAHAEMLVSMLLEAG